MVPSVLVLMTTLCCARSNAQEARPAPAFQDSVYQKSAQHGLARARSDAARLRGADEPALHESALRGPATYRFAHSSAFGRGISLLRLEQRAGGWLLISKVAQFLPGRGDSASVTHSDSVVVTDAETAALRKSIDGTGYWRGSFACRSLGIDGWSVLLEARDRNGYHAVSCWVPDEATAPTVVATVREFNELAQRSFKQSSGPK
jgi:hypothetical protein